VDVEPTILDMLNIAPWSQMEGVSLLPLISGTGERTPAEESLLPTEIALAEAILYGEECKSLSAYPWKIIYNINTEEVAFFNLAEDPGELTDISEETPESLTLLQQTLYRTLFSISDTWFLEFAGGGEPHIFDIRITSKSARGVGRFEFHKIIDNKGEILETDAFSTATIEPSVIEIRDLEVTDPLILAFKLKQKKAPAEFDLRIDGEPAIMTTFIGDATARPMTIPFTEKAPDAEGDAGRLGKPERRPEGPYFLLWLERSQYDEETTIELDEETKRELRSLGYIQ
jgi:hypothetical protein